METKVQNGYLLLADLSGYTGFMATSELEHAQEILSELISLVIKNLKSIFNIAEIEGDAIFAFAPESKFSRGETLLELIETTYYNFILQKKVMQDRTTCTCKACQSIVSLDLKFINHFGNFVLQNYAGIDKPVGSDVNLIHRLLKNSVKEKSNIISYSLFTDQSFTNLDIPKDIFIPHSEYYEHFGNVNTYLINLSDSYRRLVETKKVMVKEDEGDYVARYHFEKPPAIIWEWLIYPQKRNLWMKGATWSKGERPKGRTVAGATNHCAHGKDSSLEIILDWKPFEYFTYEIKSKPLILMGTVKITGDKEGTHLSEAIKIKNKIPRFLAKPLAKIIALKVAKVYECYKKIDELSKKV